jgi:hypothetical protein
VRPNIKISEETRVYFKGLGILDCDFYRADVMSDDGNSISMVEKLTVILKNDNYRFQEFIHGMQLSGDIGFTDNGEAYRRFWNKYGRPPAEEYRQHIIDRRDLLVPQNIREVKGSFFTPAIWADKSKDYLEKVFGSGWQNEYYIWDCAAGTGNLLAGLTNKYNVWASDIDAVNVEIIKSLIDVDKTLNLLPAHVFQFDFLNDSLGFFDTNTPCKLPEELKKIITDPEKRKKLIIYINPPYAEASSATTFTGTGQNKQNVATAHKTSGSYKDEIGRGINELFAQFFIKIYKMLPDAKLASFSTLKYINSQNFVKFRKVFQAEFKGGFICHARTFDNVNGKFPIGFLIWDMESKQQIKNITVDIYESDAAVDNCWMTGEKTFYAINESKYIVDWLRNFFDKTGTRIRILTFSGNRFSNEQQCFYYKPSY